MALAMAIFEGVMVPSLMVSFTPGTSSRKYS